MAGICSLFHLFPEIICSCFFIILHRTDLEFSKSSIWKRKKSEVTKTSEQSGLEPETICSRIFGLFTWAICDLTNAGGKKLDETISVTAPPTTRTSTALASVRYAQTQSFRFALFEKRDGGEPANLPGIRLLFSSASKNKVYIISTEPLCAEVLHCTLKTFPTPLMPRQL